MAATRLHLPIGDEVQSYRPISIVYQHHGRVEQAVPRRANKLELTHEQHLELERLSCSRDRAVARRASILVKLSLGLDQRAAAKRFGVSENMVSRWVLRYRRDGVAGLQTAPKSGRRRTPDEIVQQICAAKPGEITAKAEELGISRSTAMRLRAEQRTANEPPRHRDDPRTLEELRTKHAAIWSDHVGELQVPSRWIILVDMALTKLVSIDRGVRITSITEKLGRLVITVEVDRNPRVRWFLRNLAVATAPPEGRAS